MNSPLTSSSKYRRIAGTDVVVPIMSLGEDMKKLTLGDGGYSKDPIMLASDAGRLPTFKDVKKSLKVHCEHFYVLTTKSPSDIDQDLDSSNNPDGRSSKYYASVRCNPPLMYLVPRTSICYLQSILLSVYTTNLRASTLPLRRFRGQSILFLYAREGRGPRALERWKARDGLAWVSFQVFGGADS